MLANLRDARDGLDDYLDLDDKTGLLKAYLNVGEDKGSEFGWKFRSIGTIASGLGPGKRVRIADIDGDGARYRPSDHAINQHANCSLAR